MTRSEVSGARVATCSFTLFFFLILFALASPARAAERDEAGARVLFGEGRKLADAGRYAEACLKFEESLRLDPGVGTSFNLADCHEHVGRTATAWARFLEVAAATKRQGQIERARVAQARADALEPRLARWVIAVEAPAPDLVVERDELAVGAAAWGIPVPVDPGPHQIEARASGRKPWSHTTTVPDGPGTIEIAVPALEPLPPLLAPSAVPATGVPASRVEAPVREPWRGPPRATVVLAAAGVVALAAGAYFFVQYRSENEQAKALCPDTFCQVSKDKEDHTGLVEDARRDRALAAVTAGLGAAAVLTGAYVWWRRPRASPPATRVEMRLAGGPLGVRLEGAW